jgi:hypothetical protein
VWPFEQIANSGVLRVCRDAIELWARAPGGLVLQRREVLATAMVVPALEEAVARLFAVPGGARRVEVVLESCWLPVMALHPSSRQRDVAALESLLRERLAGLHESGEDPVGRWALQVDGLPGEPIVLGYGLPARVRDGITRALRNAKVQALSLQPALAWARSHVSQRLARRHSGWWFWQESDRTVIMGLYRGRGTSLHPASPPLQDGADVATIAAYETARTGTSPGDAILVGGWSEPRLPDGAARWLGVAATPVPAPARRASESAMPSAQEQP